MRGVTSNTSWAQAFSEGRIIEVALGLIEVANRVALRHGAVAQAGNPRENETHPVGPLVRRGSVLRRPGRTGSLRLHEANEIRIGHEGSVRHALISAPPRWRKFATTRPLRTAQKQKTGGRQPSPCVGCLKSQEADMICNCMTLFRALFPTILVSTIAQPQLLLANPLSPPSGSYELTARLELPHLERWGVDKTAIICLSNSRGPDEIPVPVVSANNPFAKCSATNLVADGSKLEYDIVCPERGAARGHAVYELSSNAFTGRIAMVMGAKNMTMTEVQRGRRIGECSPAKLGSAQQF
jgi:hypothetical protein